MKIPAVLSITVVMVATSALSQTEDYSAYTTGSTFPHVLINDRSVSLQKSLFPDYYENRSAVRDMRWVRQNDSTLIAFWQESAIHTLELLAELSGIPWAESDFDIHLVRYYPSVGSSTPLIIPTGGIRRGALTQAAPTGVSMKLNLIYQLAHRNLAQATPPLDTLNPIIARHPLMQPGPYRRDNLAMLLALVTCQQIIGLDSTYEAYQSAFWKQHTPGRQILQDYLLSEWILSADRPMARWIAEEPHTSKLVAITRTPRRAKLPDQTRKEVYIEGLPLKGSLGFSVRTDESNRLVVDKIDVFRLAYACGLREGDIIRGVNGRRPRTHKDLIEKIMAAIDEGGATLRITREGQTESVVIQTLELPAIDDSSYWDFFEDSLHLDQPLPTDSLHQAEPD